MIQEIIVGIIGLCVGALLIRKIYDFFFNKKKTGGICGCDSCHCNTSKNVK